MITVVTDTQKCGACNKNDAVMLCTGCGIPLCRSCYHFDLFAFGCGSATPLVLCDTCYNDIDINPYRAKESE